MGLTKWEMQLNVQTLTISGLLTCNFKCNTGCQEVMLLLISRKTSFLGCLFILKILWVKISEITLQWDWMDTAGAYPSHKTVGWGSSLLVFAELPTVTESHSATTNMTTQTFLKTKTVNYYAKPCTALYSTVGAQVKTPPASRFIIVLISLSCYNPRSIINHKHRLCHIADAPKQVW